MATNDDPNFLGTPFKSTDQLRSLREDKTNKSPELLKASEANTLYYRANPLDDTNLETILTFMDEFARERDTRNNRNWVAGGLEKYGKCVYDNPDESPGERIPEEQAAEQKSNADLAAVYRKNEGNSSKLSYVDDVMMENLLRAQADQVKEKLKIQKYKKHMQVFLKVYKLLKGGDMDYADALGMVNASGVREGYTCGLIDHKETSSFWELSRHSFPIKMETFAVNRKRLLRAVAKQYSKAFIILKGAEMIQHFDTTDKYPFRQEPFFLWTFGAMEPSLWGCIDGWTGKSILLALRLQDNDYYNRKKNGLPILSELKTKYEVDEVHYFDQLHEIIARTSPSEILILEGVNSDSGRDFPSINVKDELNNIEVDSTALYNIMCNLRAEKTNFELDLVRYASMISSLGHRLVMKRISADSYEYQAEALFKFFVHFVGNCSQLSHEPICASGHNSADPDYNSNTRLIKCEDLIIIDMGGSFYGYASSIACTIPASGLFNCDQKTIYNIVLNARNSALDVIKAGVYWSEVHECAVRALLRGLRDIGLIKGEIDNMLLAGVASVFMPFGVGHLLGINKFDVGGSTEEMSQRNCSEHLSCLRTHRMMKPGMVMVVQVGCYFNPREIIKSSADHNVKMYYVREKLKSFLSFGGVFLKDNIIITPQGYEMLTDLPRTIDEVEGWIAGKYVDDFNFDFSLQQRVGKDELWLGQKTNPCVNNPQHNTI